MEAAGLSEMLVSVYKTIWRHTIHKTFVGETERLQLGCLDVDGMIILKLLLKNKHFCTEDRGSRFL
jgi:hypothetical protein